MALTSKGGILLDAAGRVYEGPVAAGETVLDADVADFLDSTTEAEMRTALGATATGDAVFIAATAAAARTAIAIDGAAVVADEATADGSDAATTQALANALKVKVNALLAELRTANIIPSA